MANEKSGFQLEAFCIGFSRTGTNSLKLALESLCGGRCLHMFYAIELDLTPTVSKILSGKMSDNKLKSFFEEYDFRSAADFPFLGFWERTMELYPNSKVILTVRDPKAWVESFKTTITLRHGRSSYRRRFPYNIYRHLPSSWNRASNLNEDIPLLMNLCDAVDNGNGVEFFNDWIEEVKSKVPKDRLLIYEVKDGWEPLCKFLNKPIPDIPFPKTNDKELFKKNFIDKQMRQEVLVVMAVTIVPAVAALFSVFAFQNFNKITSKLGGWFNQ